VVYQHHHDSINVLFRICFLMNARLSVKTIIGCFLLLTLLSSCATVFNGTRQKVMITSTPPGADIYLNGLKTGYQTPTQIKVYRKVSPGPNHRRNEQHYVLKKEGYADYEIKDRRSFSTAGMIGNSAAGLMGGLFLAVAANPEEEYQIQQSALTLAVPMLMTFPIDFLTGAIYQYQKNISATLSKKEVEEKIVYVRGDSASTGTGTEDRTNKLSNIYAVIVGVSEYQDKNMNLQYADADARLFYNFLRSPNGGLVPEQNISLLLNKDASRANVIKAMNTKFRNAFEDDLVIVYIASHGIPSSQGDELYFLGSDSDKENLEGTGIAQADIMRALNNTRSQKKVWIADACHSGGVGLNTKGLRSEQTIAESNMVNRLLSNVANYSSNLILLTASSAGETSRESRDWGGGHGVFTHYLVEGLKGAADENKNGLVDIREVYEYVRQKVSEATGKKQYPELKGVYQDRFPMSVVK
jgi:uncharacterized caspase-like protein